jgi:hypothetical protein
MSIYQRQLHCVPRPKIVTIILYEHAVSSEIRPIGVQANNALRDSPAVRNAHTKARLRMDGGQKDIAKALQRDITQVVELWHSLFLFWAHPTIGLWVPS